MAHTQTQPNTLTEVRDELLLELGLALSHYLLEINRTLAVPRDMALPPPWNLPSRLFHFPIEIGEPLAEGTRSIGLMHPLLSDHPFVQHVITQLGAELNPDGALNAHGVSAARAGRWWHAVDLVTAGQWRALIETQRFTTPEDIAGAVAYGLDYSPHDAPRPGYLTTTEARELIRAIGAGEPKDRAATLFDMATPMVCRSEKGAERWPINASQGTDAITRAWGRILGIECGWFTYDRAGFLQWSAEGRDRHAAGGAATFTESGTGQITFAF